MEKKQFYRRVFTLVVPMALQNLINVGVTATDVLMLGKVSEQVLSGCSLGGQVFFIFNLFLFGISSGVSVLTAQYWGKRDTVSIEKLMGIVMRLALFVGLIFMFGSFCFPESLMRIFTNEPEVIAEGVKYLRIVAFTYPMVALSMTYLNLIRSIERVLVSTVVYGCSLLLNFVVNAVLIFGLFGAPKLGIVGAAAGTLCARLLELVMMLFYAYFRNRTVRLRLTYFLHQDKPLLKDFFHYSGPVVVNEFMWGAGYSAMAAIVGHLGSSAVAANSVAHVMRQLATVIVFGIGNATAILLGKAIGEGKTQEAKLFAGRLMRLAVVFGMIGGALIFAIRPLIIKGFGFTGLTADYMHSFLFMMSYYVVAQSATCTCIVGVLRAGGDTKFGMFVDSGILWGCSIFLGSLAAFVWKLPVKTVYFVLMSDELVKIPFCYFRYKQGKWLKNVTR
ncbi:MAG: MATE family efflux transporter [Lachnospiraceae bacterium]|nr:MATE family efflux transporter [Lachnospiraceae bacterium]